MHQKPIQIFLLLLVIILLAGGSYFYGYSAGQNNEKIAAQQKQNSIIQEIFGKLMIFSLSGKIIAIAPDKKSLTVEVPGLMGVNLPKDYQSKTVLISGQTKIISRENKPADVFSAEMAKYQQDMKKAKNLIIAAAPPLPQIEKDISIDDLKIGDQIIFNFNFNSNSAILSSLITANQIVVSR